MLFGIGALLTACPSAKPAATLTSSESWCPDHFEVGPSDTCFAVPETTTKATPILIYLHGPYAGHGSAEEWEIVHSAVAKGFAVVVPRGKRGLCAWTAEVKDHFCWPQEVEDPQAFKAAVADWDRVLWQVDAILESGSHNKRYILGYSQGGLFASYLASHALFPAQAYAIVNGGPLGPMKKPPSAAPLILLSAENDAAQAPKMTALHDDLNKASWPHAYCTHPGGHALSASDFDAALAFFKRDADGSLKAKDNAYTCDGKDPAK
ncbi:MAG: hypothetical protein KF819_07350 [Labilithrix sp.]|nr:hypothetical protein [Labilithrix sp.]